MRWVSCFTSGKWANVFVEKICFAERLYEIAGAAFRLYRVVPAVYSPFFASFFLRIVARLNLHTSCPFNSDPTQPFFLSAFLVCARNRMEDKEKNDLHNKSARLVGIPRLYSQFNSFMEKKKTEINWEDDERWRDGKGEFSVKLKCMPKRGSH